MEYFGELGFVTGLPRNASVMTLSYLSVFRIPRKTLIRLVSRNFLDY